MGLEAVIVIVTRHEMIEEFSTTISPALITRFNEREENVNRAGYRELRLHLPGLQVMDTQHGRVRGQLGGQHDGGGQQLCSGCRQVQSTPRHTEDRSTTTPPLAWTITHHLLQTLLEFLVNTVSSAERSLALLLLQEVQANPD